MKTLEQLKSENKHLSDLLANQDKEVEMLRELLKECKPYIEANIDIQMDVGHYPELEYDILSRINAAIGESEER